MNRWVDVKPGDWFYNDVLEASNLVLDDDSFWITGMTYSAFEDGKPYLYYEADCTSAQTSFILPVYISPTADNPLSVYVDGVRVLYKDVLPNVPAEGQTQVNLYIAPKIGSIVSFISWGKPTLDSFTNRPMDAGETVYPSVQLSNSDYKYIPYWNRTQEYVVAFGHRLRRVDLPYKPGDNIYTLFKQYVGVSNDLYWISPQGILFTPYSLNGVTCTVSYYSLFKGMVVENVRPSSPRVSHCDRFFPQAQMYKCELAALLNRIRRYFYVKFTDLEAPCGVDQTITTYLGQNVFKLDGHFEESGLSVFVNGSRVYSGFNVYEDMNSVVFTTPFDKGIDVSFLWQKTSSKFIDVNSAENTDAWWRPHVLELEDEVVDGVYILDTDDGNFYPYAPVTRCQMVAITNRFRKWCLERFR